MAEEVVALTAIIPEHLAEVVAEVVLAFLSDLLLVLKEQMLEMDL